MTLEEIETQLAELETKRQALEDEARDARKARRDSVTRQRRFTFVPHERAYDKLWDSSCRWWYLSQEVLNREECLAAGWSEEELGHNRGMGYLFNSASGKLVHGWGGGTIYIIESSCTFGLSKDERAQADVDAKVVVEKLGLFARQYPAGGDVTDIIMAQRHFKY